jgi:hypothetical protein
MKKSLLTFIFAALLTITLSNGANASACSDGSTNCADARKVSSASQVLNAYLTPLYYVSVSTCSVPSANIQQCGNLDANLVAGFDIKANTASSWVKLSAAKVSGKDVMEKVGSTIRLVLVRDGATATSISNALLSTPGANPNVIAYNVATEPVDLTWNTSDKTIGKVLSGQNLSVKLKVLPTAVAGTYTFPDDMSGSYKATIICTALEP